MLQKLGWYRFVDNGKVTTYLGIVVTRRGEILKRLGMSNCNQIHTPFNDKEPLKE